MAQVSTYLNFSGNTEEAFTFYRQVFGTEFVDGIARFGDVQPEDTGMPLSDEAKNYVMHVALPILGGHMLMGTDATQATGFEVSFGNNMYINLEPDTCEETDRLFAALSEGGSVATPLKEMFWGDYYGSCTDKFGVCWMFNCSSKAE